MLRKIGIENDHKISGIAFGKLHNALKGSLIFKDRWAYFAAARLDLAGFATLVWRELFLCICEYVEDPDYVMKPLFNLFDRWKTVIEQAGESIRNSHVVPDARCFLLSAVHICMSATKTGFRKLYVNSAALHSNFNMKISYLEEIVGCHEKNLPEEFYGLNARNAAFYGLAAIYLICAEKNLPLYIKNFPLEYHAGEIRHFMAQVLPMLVTWGFTGHILKILYSARDTVRDVQFIEKCFVLFEELKENLEEKGSYGRERALLMVMIEEFFRRPTVSAELPPDNLTIENILVFYDQTEETPPLPNFANRNVGYEENLIYRYGSINCFVLDRGQKTLFYQIMAHIRSKEIVNAQHGKTTRSSLGVRGMYNKMKAKHQFMKRQSFVLEQDVLRSSGSKMVQHTTFASSEFVWVSFFTKTYDMRTKPTSIFSDSYPEFDCSLSTDWKCNLEPITSGDVLSTDNVLTLKGPFEDKSPLRAFHRINTFKRIVDPEGKALAFYKYEGGKTTINGEKYFCIVKQHLMLHVPDRVSQVVDELVDNPTMFCAYLLARYALCQTMFPAEKIAVYRTQRGRFFLVTLDDFERVQQPCHSMENFVKIKDFLIQNRYILRQFIDIWLVVLVKQPNFSTELQRVRKMGEVIDNDYELLQEIGLNF